MSEKKVSWGILGTGSIANVFANGIKGSDAGELYAIASRSIERSKLFADSFNVPVAYHSYEALLADKNVDAVYIALPHPQHKEWAIKAAGAGKHILCEKPIAMTYSEALEITMAARKNDVFLMEGYMYRCHPQTAKIIELIKHNIIGDVRVIQATFSFHAEVDDITLSNQRERGGGGILDVGGYPVSMARLLAGVAVGKAFADPIEVYGAAHIGEISNVDEWVIGAFKFEGGILAQVAAGTSLVQENAVRVFGSKGYMFIPSPWVPGGREPGTTKIFIHRHGEKYPEEILTSTTLGLYSLEADTVAANINMREAKAMTLDDTLGNMKTLDRWRKAVGVSYPSDRNSDS